MLLGCVKEPDAGSITVEASIGAPTKVAYDGATSRFAEGDRIAVYAWTGSASSVPDTRVVDGVVNTFDGSAWTPASLMRWRNDSDAHYFLGVSPVHAISSFTADEYTLDPADYTASDLLFARNLDGIKSGDGAVKLAFRHAMAKLKVNLTFRNQFGGTPEVGAVTLSARKTASVNYLTQTVGATGDAASVSLPAETANSSYSAILVPQDGIRKISVTIAGKDYVYAAGEDIPLASGQVTTLNLTVGKGKLELVDDISIQDWANDVLSEQEISPDRGVFQLNAYFPADQLPGSSFWQNKDVILVLCKVEGKSFVSNTYAKSLKMTHNGTAWTVAEMLNGTASPGCLGLEEGDQVTMRAVYLPNDNPTVVPDGKGGYAFLGLISGEADNSSNCYLTATLSATMSGGRLSGCFDLALPERVMLFKIAYSSGYSVSTRFLREPHLTPLGLKGFTADLDAVNADPVHGAPLKRLYGRFSGDSSAPNVFCAELDEGLDNVWTDYHFTRVTNDGAFAGYGKRLALSGAVSRVLALPALASSDWQALTYTPVDLGCEVDDPIRGGKKRIYWATCNVGADNPEDYGDYFAWGETTKKGTYDWSTYIWGDLTGFTKYTVGSTTVLEPADDAATANWGGNWRTPTDAEWTWLRDDTNCEWDWQYDYNSVKGMLVTSKVNGNQIFLPSAGYWCDASLGEDGSSGYYWSSSLDESYFGTAREVDFNSGEVRRMSGCRFYGQSVRPVTD